MYNINSNTCSLSSTCVYLCLCYINVCYSNSRKNEGMEPKQKQYPVLDVSGVRSKVQCCKEQCCIGTLYVRSMNQGKLEIVKQEMTRVNVDILRISELKWTGRVNLTQMNIISTSVGKNPLEEME